MATYVLIPGAGGAASYWNRVIPLLERSGHEVVAVDLPGAELTAGLPEYADLVVAAAQPFPGVILVGVDSRRRLHSPDGGRTPAGCRNSCSSTR